MSKRCEACQRLFVVLSLFWIAVALLLMRGMPVDWGWFFTLVIPIWIVWAILRAAAWVLDALYPPPLPSPFEHHRAPTWQNHYHLRNVTPIRHQRPE